jgi:hypothetical protein
MSFQFNIRDYPHVLFDDKKWCSSLSSYYYDGSRAAAFPFLNPVHSR